MRRVSCCTKNHWKMWRDDQDDANLEIRRAIVPFWSSTKQPANAIVLCSMHPGHKMRA